MISIHLPSVNAALNGLSACFLAAGWLFIRRKRIEPHRACMLGAVTCSILFLVSYLYHHYHAGVTRFPGSGASRTAYLAILLSHTALAVAVLPMASRTLWLAWKERFDTHAALARWALPTWLYVSVTGVVVYCMLYRMTWR